MNVYSRLTGLAGITGTSFTLIDDSKSQKSLIATNIDGALNISGQINDVQLTNNFIVDGFLDVSLKPFNTLELTSSDIIINAKNTFDIVNENNDTVLKIDNNRSVTINADSVNIIADSEFYIDDVKVVNIKQIPQLVIIKNPVLTPNNSIAIWEKTLSDSIKFIEVPMMQVVSNDGELVLAQIKYNIDAAKITVTIDKVDTTIPADTYKLMLFGYCYNNEIKTI